MSSKWVRDKPSTKISQKNSVLLLLLKSVLNPVKGEDDFLSIFHSFFNRIVVSAVFEKAWKFNQKRIPKCSQNPLRIWHLALEDRIFAILGRFWKDFGRVLCGFGKIQRGSWMGFGMVFDLMFEGFLIETCLLPGAPQSTKWTRTGANARNPRESWRILGILARMVLE